MLMTEKLSIRIVGNSANLLELKNLTATAEMVLGDESADDTQYLLADGAHSDANELIQSSLSTWLDAGKTIAIWNPSEQQLAQLQNLTGMGAPATEELAAVVITKHAQPANGYHLSVVPKQAAEKVTLTVATADADEHHAPETSEVEAVEIDREQLLLQHLIAHGTFDASGSSLYPPSGATFGTAAQYHPYNVTWGAPTCNGNADDYTAGTNTQSPTGGVWNYYYVYYVDGEGGQPYYIVILKQTVQMSPSQRIASSYNSNGYFQYAVELNNNQPTAAWGSSANVNLLRQSPSTSTDGASHVRFEQSMRLMVDNNGGQVATPFSAIENCDNAIPGWGVIDQSSAGRGITDWYFHQIDTWDPTVNPPGDFGNWWASVFHGKYNGQVNDMPSLSYSNLQVETITAWRVDASSKDVSLNVSGSIGQSLALLHNYNGCTGASGSRHHHLYSGSYPIGWTDPLDLGKIVSQGY
ncbi:hypothetical protein CIG75_05190 [Tumebacillus algifaecis]|uniref:Uncharacterized protein n=1 Tax=Tumebacillus algifaecis TaxID=1214604 RepID=A0A223CYN4_9BACL|nr:hypothetical protein [Tumebacillus algifaecis]ASS74442.1 hypothetical protein CIG75_05190 [Tumebacillus algifaecis]